VDYAPAKGTAGSRSRRRNSELVCRLGEAEPPRTTSLGAPRPGWRGLFLPDASGRRPATARTARFAADPTGRTWCCFTSTSTGQTAAASGPAIRPAWTALVLRCIEDQARRRASPRCRPRRRRPAASRRAGDERADRARRPHRVAGGGRPGRLRLRTTLGVRTRRLSRTAPGRDDSADGSHGARQWAGCLGRA